MLKKSHFRYQDAFTLVEVLLVSAMIGVIAVSLYQALSNGLKIWERSRVFSVEEDVMIFFDRMTMDLRNAFDFSLFEFEGESGRIVFSTIVSVPLARSGSEDVFRYTDQIGRAEYGFDPVSKTLYRREANYGQAVKGDFGPKKVFARPVDRMRIKYFERDQLGVSEKKLDQAGLPAAVEVSIEYYDGQGQLQKITRMINLPLFL